nr:MAG TPA: hypothetical protein [Caudoviricetes sp.]
MNLNRRNGTLKQKISEIIRSNSQSISHKFSIYHFMLSRLCD